MPDPDPLFSLLDALPPELRALAREEFCPAPRPPLDILGRELISDFFRRPDVVQETLCGMERGIGFWQTSFPEPGPRVDASFNPEVNRIEVTVQMPQPVQRIEIQVSSAQIGRPARQETEMQSEPAAMPESGGLASALSRGFSLSNSMAFRERLIRSSVWDVDIREILRENAAQAPVACSAAEAACRPPKLLADRHPEPLAEAPVPARPQIERVQFL